ncbi:hypothetical protein ENSA5_42080 [Enhygromyxa salina]|uniref:Uncharacterized protein n=1 Tax=Enhygromyxa salina TaxID=215803 RepID=A0A2S9XLQ4_9BACT|nr:hypothetical protein [Enhygromyxa salina]PRP93806.1 hypothetical protein ENSA5_42080 [Enhygromyxa salina]
MPLFPLAFMTLAILLPTLLHRWEHVGVSPHLAPTQWARGLWAVVLSLILSFVAALFALSVGRGHAINMIPLAAVLVLLFPWPITRFVLIPLGWWRAAWNMAQLSGWVWRGDVAGGQLVAGAWAVLRRRRPSAAAIAWLSAERDELPSLGAPGVLGSALLADALGDHAAARRLMQIVAEFDGDQHPPLTRYLANEWLVADAASRGAWAEVELRGRSPHRRSRATRLLGDVAARLIGYPPVPSNLALILRWLVAPSRLQTLALVRRALREPQAEVVPAVRRPSELPAAPLEGPALLAAHSEAIASGKIPTDQLMSLGRSWDRLLADPALRSQTAHRALALRAGDPDSVLERLGRQVEADLFALARAGAVPLAELEGDSKALRRVARELRHELLDELAIMSEGLDARVRARRQLAPLDELREFLTIREHYEQVCELGGNELVRVAFSQIHDPMCKLAVWLWDERGDSSIANAMFRWLGHEAVMAGDEEAAELQRRNVACGR